MFFLCLIRDDQRNHPLAAIQAIRVFNDLFGSGFFSSGVMAKGCCRAIQPGASPIPLVQETVHARPSTRFKAKADSHSSFALNTEFEG